MSQGDHTTIKLTGYEGCSGKREEVIIFSDLSAEITKALNVHIKSCLSRNKQGCRQAASQRVFYSKLS